MTGDAYISSGTNMSVRTHAYVVTAWQSLSFDRGSGDQWQGTHTGDVVMVLEQFVSIPPAPWLPRHSDFPHLTADRLAPSVSTQSGC